MASNVAIELVSGAYLATCRSWVSAVSSYGGALMGRLDLRALLSTDQS